MKKTAIILIVLSLVAAFVICGKVFTQDDGSDEQTEVDTSESEETAQSPEYTEKLIPYSDAYNSPVPIEDRADVDEDAE